MESNLVVLLIDNVLRPDECDALIAFSENVGFKEAPITTSRGFVMAPEIRDNTRVMVDDPNRALDLWHRLESLIPPNQVSNRRWRAVGLNERFRFYRYEQGQRFRWHRDGAFVRNAHERSHLTALLYLNDDCDGGSTQIDVSGSGDRAAPLTIEPQKGRLLLFDHSLRHQGAPVTGGRKYVLRTDVMYRHENG